MNRLVAVQDPTGNTSYKYNAIGQVTEKQAANGSVTTYAYDPRGLLYKLEDRNSAGELINQHEYSYDAAGNILRWIEKIDGQTRDKQYAYDNLDQLIQATDNGQTNTYRYDAFGNRIEKGGVVSTTYTYNTANQLLEENTGGLSKKYAYDKRGNLLTVTSGSEQLESYTFDETNRLVQAQKAGQTLKYRYTVQGARVQSKDLAGNKTQDFVIDLTSAYNDLLSVYEDNALQDSYTYGLERLHAIQVDGTVETYTYDHLGSVVGLQDTQGNLTETYRYDEFGVLQQPLQSGRSVNFAYTGYPYEPNGLYFAQARYYKPEVGRFISEDTYRGRIYSPQSLNRYGYVENNPIIFIDVHGHAKDSFGAALSMPRNAEEAAELIRQAQINYIHGVNQINKLRSGQSTGLMCEGCDEIITWKKYINSMHEWANRIRETQYIGVSAYIKAEAGASLFVGAKLGIEVKNDKLKLYFNPSYGQGGADLSIRAGISSTTDPTRKNEGSWTTNTGATVGTIFIGEANVTKGAEYVELTVGGGVGVAANVYFFPINAEKEYSAVFDLPIDLGKTAVIYPTYKGAPNTEEWLKMLSGEGW